MDDRDISILTQVAFKAAVDVFVAELTETEDFTGEVQALTQAGFEILITEIKKNQEANGGGSGNSSSRRTKKSGSGSKKRASKSSGKSKQTGPKDPNADISDAQRKLLKRLLGEAEIEYDDESFEWDGDDIFFDDLTMGTIQEYFDELK